MQRSVLCAAIIGGALMGVIVTLAIPHYKSSGKAAHADDRVPAAAGTAPSDPSGERRIKFYRNPMGLPDISLLPKKDSMGMDYIPVYEGEETDDGSVKLSPGKIQRTGVETSLVGRRSVTHASKPRDLCNSMSAAFQSLLPVSPDSSGR